jgi:hypothetical protein
MSETFKLRRTSNTPLVFQGELLAEVSGETFQDTGGKLKHHIRWYEASIYRDRNGSRFYWQIRYRTTWRNEINHDAAGWCGSVGDLVEAIRAYNPLAPVAGMPFNERTNWRQDQLLQALRLAWGEVVSELFEEAGIVEHGGGTPPNRVFLAHEMVLLAIAGNWIPLSLAAGNLHLVVGFPTLAEANAACEALKTQGVEVVPFTFD